MAGNFLDYDGLEYFKGKMLAAIDSMLDGLPAVKIVSSGEGFRAFSDGRIAQWGIAYIANGDGTRVVFPVTFPAEIENVQCTPSGTVSASCVAQADGLGAAKIKHNANGGVYVFWAAIGR